MDEGSNDNSNNTNNIVLSSELIIKLGILLIVALGAVCATRISKNSSYLIMLFRSATMKVIYVLGLVSVGYFCDYTAIIIINLLSFILFWIIHGAPISDDCLSDKDKERLNKINNLNIQEEDLEKNQNELNEDTPLLNHIIDKGKDIINNAVIETASVISKHSIGNRLNDIISKSDKEKRRNSRESNRNEHNFIVNIPKTKPLRQRRYSTNYYNNKNVINNICSKVDNQIYQENENNNHHNLKTIFTVSDDCENIIAKPRSYRRSFDPKDYKHYIIYEHEPNDAISNYSDN